MSRLSTTDNVRGVNKMSNLEKNVKCLKNHRLPKVKKYLLLFRVQKSIKEVIKIDGP